MEGNKRKTDLQLPVQENLLPGIPCEITRTIIFPKLSWRDLYTLKCVNRSWNYAVRSRQVYNERLRAQSTATFFPGRRFQNAIAFYSMGERSWYKLPPVPNLDLDPYRLGDPYRVRIPIHCRCVSMHGKIYVLGGRVHPLSRRIISFETRFPARFETSNHVFVFDVAAGGKWEQCASMKKPREEFSLWTQDGKIYVFGGRRDVTTRWDRPVFGGEVYDPDRNAWSPIKTTQSDGVVDEPFDGFAGDLAKYDASKDEWSVLSLPPERHLLFNAQGKTYFIHRTVRFSSSKNAFFGVFRLEDVHRNSWTRSHSFSFNGVLPNDYLVVHLRAILEVEDELLAIAEWSYRGSREQEHGNCLLQSRGFGNENKAIAWELRDLNFTLDGPMAFEDFSSQFFILKL